MSGADTAPMIGPSPHLGRELSALRIIGRLLPPIPRITGIVNRFLKPLYLRKPRREVVAEVLGFPMRLDPAEAIDSAFLFYPHLYDRHEIAYVRRSLRPGDVFVDVGAHIGFYSLVSALAVGHAGTVVAIEPDRLNFLRLVWNLNANQVKNVRAVNAGASDERGRRRLSINVHGNRGGNSFAAAFDTYEEVECKPLLEILTDCGIDRVTGMKVDIEGEEVPVLSRFLADADGPMRPAFMIVEVSRTDRDTDETVLRDLLARNRYRVHSSHFGNALNWIAVAESNETDTRQKVGQAKAMHEHFSIHA